MVAGIILLGLVWSEFSSLVRRNLASAVEWLLIVTDCQILDPRLSVVTPLELCLFKNLLSFINYISACHQFDITSIVDKKAWFFCLLHSEIVHISDKKNPAVFVPFLSDEKEKSERAVIWECRSSGRLVMGGCHSPLPLQPSLSGTNFLKTTF